MKKGIAKKYYKKVNTTFEGLNRQDDFAKIFNNLIDNAETSLYQRERKERRIFDDSWIKEVEDILPVIDKLTRNPGESLKKIQEVVPVERAKKIDADTVRHLAANTQLIKSTDEAGNVMPKKVLTSYSDSDLGTYENRFLMTLVDKLFTFIEIRYNLILDKAKTEYVNYLKLESTIDTDDAIIDYDITFKIHQKTAEDEVGKKNMEMLKKMTYIRQLITNYKMSRFMKDMSNFVPIRPPIMKTNVILKNYDFRACYDMWVLLDEIDQVGYDVDVYERDVKFDEKYFDDLKNAMLVIYGAISNNQVEEFEFSYEEPFNYRKKRNPKILSKYIGDEYIEPMNYIIQDNSLNQYFLDQIRRSNNQRYSDLRETGIPEKEAIDIIYERLTAIGRAAFIDFINDNFKPEEEKDINEKIKIQNKILAIYRDIERINKEHTKELSTQKAIATLSVKNYKEELKKEIEYKKLQKEIEDAEAKKKEMDKRRAEQAREIEEKKRLEKAKKILEDAEKERREKKLRELREY